MGLPENFDLNRAILRRRTSLHSKGAITSSKRRRRRERRVAKEGTIRQMNHTAKSGTALPHTHACNKTHLPLIPFWVQANHGGDERLPRGESARFVEDNGSHLPQNRTTSAQTASMSRRTNTCGTGRASELWHVASLSESRRKGVPKSTPSSWLTRTPKVQETSQPKQLFFPRHNHWLALFAFFFSREGQNVMERMAGTI